MRLDSDIKRDVEDELRWDPDIDATDKKAFWAVCLPGNGQLPARRLIHRLRGEGISRQRS